MLHPATYNTRIQQKKKKIFFFFLFPGKKRIRQDVIDEKQTNKIRTAALLLVNGVV